VTRVGEMPRSRFARRMATGATLSVPPFVVRVTSRLAPLHRSMHLLYGEFELLDDAQVPDFVIDVNGGGGWRRLFRRQAMARIDTPPPYAPLPERLAQVMFEQALNWCVATRTFTHLILHAAVVARDGRALLIPGQSGQGKSTLCAALAARGWRHVADEFALLDPANLRVTAHPRPISLKNRSLEALAAWSPEAVLSPPFEGTPKGTIGYVRPERAALDQAVETVMPVAVMFPRFAAGVASALDPMGHAAAFIALTACSVNYREFGEAGFDALARLVDGCPVLAATYGDTAAGVALAEAALDGAAS
jgi:HprK-related kinase A